jgi:DNA-binding winged helix-turn-helix (wHTH) protein
VHLRTDGEFGEVVGSAPAMDMRTPARRFTGAAPSGGLALRRFGSFELDLAAGRLLKNGRLVRIQPQPFKLLCLLTNKGEALVTREEIHTALWAGDTFVDFDQGVNFAIKQVRDALGDRADDSLYVQTVPKRGYRFIAPIDADLEEPAEGSRAATIDPELQKALWANIVELRLADARIRKYQALLAAAFACLAVLVAVVWLLAR